jgi:ribosomal subunit interface protein
MQYQITSDNMQVTPSMETLTKQKFVRLEHRFKNIPEGSKSMRVVLNTAPTDMFIVKVEILVNGKKYFSDETDYTLEGALIKTVEELVRMTEKEKDKFDRQKRSTDVADLLAEEDSLE